jgi:hypothetical protein
MLSEQPTPIVGNHLSIELLNNVGVVEQHVEGCRGGLQGANACCRGRFRRVEPLVGHSDRSVELRPQRRGRRRGHRYLQVVDRPRMLHHCRLPTAPPRFLGSEAVTDLAKDLQLFLHRGLQVRLHGRKDQWPLIPIVSTPLYG